jgi:hypothetical protein
MVWIGVPSFHRFVDDPLAWHHRLLLALDRQAPRHPLRNLRGLLILKVDYGVGGRNQLLAGPYPLTPLLGNVQSMKFDVAGAFEGAQRHAIEVVFLQIESG